MMPGEKPKISPADRIKDWRFKPGGVRPSNKPKSTPSIMAAVRRYLVKYPHKVDKLAQCLIEGALQGKGDRLRYLIELLNRLDGLPMQKVEHSGEMHVKRIILDEGGEAQGYAAPENVEGRN